MRRFGDRLRYGCRPMLSLVFAPRSLRSHGVAPQLLGPWLRAPWLRRLALAGGCWFFGAGCRLDPGMALEPTLQRPLLAATTETTGFGSLQLEAGVASDPGSQLAFPGAVRVGLSDATEGYLRGDLLRWDFDADVAGQGNLLVGVRHRLLEEQGALPALAIQMQTKLPTAQASDGFGSNAIDWDLALIADREFGALETSWFAQAGYLGVDFGTGTDFESTLAASVRWPFATRWSAYLQGAAVVCRSQDRRERYLGGGLIYRVGAQGLLDVGVLQGYGDAPEDVLLMIGYTRNAGSFYRVR